MRYCRLCFIFGIVLLSNAAFAAGPRLDVSLAAASPPSHGVVFGVGTDGAKLAKNQTAPLPGTSVDSIAPLYNHTTQYFGDILAVASSKMVLIGTPPEEPDIYDGMPAQDAFIMLVGMLSDDQWRQVTSQQGLPLTSLQGKQGELFGKVLPDGLKVVPWYGMNQMYTDKDIQDLSQRLPLSSLRFASTWQVEIAYRNNMDYQVNAIPPTDSAITYKLVGRKEYGGSQDSLYGGRARFVVPNKPKVSQLDYRSKLFKTMIPLDGLTTVGSLIAAISKATHTEIYADSRFESRRLTLLFPKSNTVVHTHAMPASDLLQAMAFCLTSTYRKVGSAYVLTDDVVGIGAKTQMWLDFEMNADRLRRHELDIVADNLLKRHSSRDVSTFGDSVAATPEQLGTIVDPGNGLNNPVSLNATFGELTSAQQDLVRRADRQFEQDYDYEYKHDHLQPPMNQTRVNLYPQMTVQLLTPGIDTPIDLALNTDMLSLFRPLRKPIDPDLSSPRPILDYWKLHPEAAEAFQKRYPKFYDEIMHPTGPAPTLKSTLAKSPHRAVIVRAASADEVKLDLAGLQQLGFNEMWLMVFEHGAANIPGSALSSPDAASGDTDILSAAVSEGHKRGISVFPCLNLLTWGTAPPVAARDYNILGQTSRELWTIRQANGGIGDEQYMTGASSLDIPTDLRGDAVSPAAFEVTQPLTSLVKSLSAYPGIGGMVWRETSTAGYGPTYPEIITSSRTLGYNVPLRLAFLRQSHVDPVDIVSPNDYTGKANTDLPLLPNGDMNDIIPKWLRFRRERNEAFLRSLYDIVRPAAVPDAKKLSLIIKQRGLHGGLGAADPGLYQTWEARGDIPAAHSDYEADSIGADPIPKPDTHSKLDYRVLTRAILNRMSSETRLFGVMPGDAAFVVDLTGDNMPENENAVHALAADMGEKLETGP